ncbi:MAG: stage II sporulation protein R [Clostridiales bacterium]|nr:stage II sporulation protein R [Clostridiales bacterium]
MQKLVYNGSILLLLALAVFFVCEAASPRILKEPAATAARPPANAAWQGAAWQPAACPDENLDVLRLHIVANSDSAEDQRVKLLVRDMLLAHFAPANSLRQAEELLLDAGDDVLAAVGDVLLREGCAYGAQLRFGVMDFPARAYAGVLYPAGAYEALRVELGAAGGQNWWCVLFPPLCLVDIATADLPGTDELVFESDIAAYLKRLKAGHKKQ